MADGPRADASAPAARARVASNMEPPAERGRLFVVVFDDVHLSPLNAQRAKAAVAAFVDRGAQAGDRVLLVATGGARLVERAAARRGAPTCWRCSSAWTAAASSTTRRSG